MTLIASSIVGQTSGSVIIDSGTPFHVSGTIAASPGATVTVFSFSVPVATTRKVNTLFVTSENPGRFSLESGGSEIAAGELFEAEKNITFKFDPTYPISAGTLVELKYTAPTEPSGAGCPVSGFLSANDFT